MQADDRLRIEWELTRLSSDFAHYLDTRAYEDLAALFLPDGVWDRAMARHKGREEILAAMSKRPADVVTRHVQTNFRYAHIDADTVRGVVYLISFHGPSAGGALPGLLEPHHFSVLEFHDLYKRTTDGWRFAERIGRPALVAADSPLRGVNP